MKFELTPMIEPTLGQKQRQMLAIDQHTLLLPLSSGTLILGHFQFATDTLDHWIIRLLDHWIIGPWDHWIFFLIR